MAKELESIVQSVITYFLGNEAAKDFYERLAPVVAAAVEHEAKQAAALLSTEVDSSIWMSEWLTGLPDRIRNINEVTANLIRKILIDGYEAGKSIEEIADDVARLFEIFDRTRSLLIARTEILGASNFGAWSAYRQYGVPFKRWVSTMDDRVRDTHAEAHGQVQSVHDPFSVGLSYLMYPGDPDGPAKEVINCRCILVPEWSPERSVWANTYIKSLWEAYIIRTTPLENLAAEQIRIVFDNQHSAVKLKLS